MQFVNLIKPTHICNLGCTYCYNDDERAPVMSDEVLERTIDQIFAFAAKVGKYDFIDFTWHGGEPMVPGIAFYEKAIQFQQKYSRGLKYSNNMQTNGVLINDKWIKFFKQHQFSIGISIDGPKHLHDRYRVDLRGRGSFDRVMQAIDLVRANDIPFGVVVVISRANIEHVEEIYEFLARNNLGFNVVPMNKSGGARELYQDLGLEANEYGDAWIRMYDHWFDAKPNYVPAQDFECKTRSIIYGRGAECNGLGQCGNSTISIDPLGDIYPCGSLSAHGDTLYGNIMQADLAQLMNSSTAISYRHREVDPHCAVCKWQHVCHGGCPARSYKFYGDHHHRDYYCPSLYRMYEHVEQRLLEKGVVAGLPHPEHFHDGLPEMAEEARLLAEQFAHSAAANGGRVIELQLVK